jgi:hypothetical protein
MISLRLITCFILSAIQFSSCALLTPEVPQRVVRVKALADPSLRERNPRWDSEIRGLIDASSYYFEKEFGIRFVTQSTAPWPARARIPSTAGLLVSLKNDYPLAARGNDYDLIVAFTAERVDPYFGGRARVDRIGNCKEGLGNYVVTYVSEPFRNAGPSDELHIDVISLIHELGHIFGAEHTKDTYSIMHENFEYRSEFDRKNRSVILHNRKCPFAK